MYVRHGINSRHIARDSWHVVVASTIWSSFVVLMFEVVGFRSIAIPIEPVTTIGIVVSLYLGFKSASAYDRWWEARKVWGSIVNDSRIWANDALTFVTGAGPAEARTLVLRHLAWVNALAYQLRKNTRLKAADHQHIFDRRLNDITRFSVGNKDCYRHYLTPEEVEEISQYANPAVHIIRKQGVHVQALLNSGAIDNNRVVGMAEVLGRFYDSQGMCERIKNAPFPRQITHFGRLFTYVFIVLMPFALLDAFATEAQEIGGDTKGLKEYMFALVPFTVLISWLFYMMEKVSESCEDPFEWGTTDVPIAAITRTIEIDLLQMLGDTDLPQPVEPLNGVLY